MCNNEYYFTKWKILKIAYSNDIKLMDSTQLTAMIMLTEPTHFTRKAMF